MCIRDRKRAVPSEQGGAPVPAYGEACSGNVPGESLRGTGVRAAGLAQGCETVCRGRISALRGGSEDGCARIPEGVGAEAEIRQHGVQPFLCFPVQKS